MDAEFALPGMLYFEIRPNKRKWQVLEKQLLLEYHKIKRIPLIQYLRVILFVVHPRSSRILNQTLLCWSRKPAPRDSTVEIVSSRADECAASSFTVKSILEADFPILPQAKLFSPLVKSDSKSQIEELGEVRKTRKKKSLSEELEQDQTSLGMKLDRRRLLPSKLEASDSFTPLAQLTAICEPIFRLLRKKFNECESRYSDLERTSCALAWAARRLREKGGAWGYINYYGIRYRKEGPSGLPTIKRASLYVAGQPQNGMASSDKQTSGLVKSEFKPDGRLSGSTIKEERIRFYGTSSKIATKI
ncbi:hypothetical protein ACH5RR_039304 [Cinchona calisaya]|uniref:Uncharacterized protein n=1 Tax=Cinchona calisaya TaxID=153742 RepID=A0ABD2XXU5_9GENT